MNSQRKTVYDGVVKENVRLVVELITEDSTPKVDSLAVRLRERYDKLKHDEPFGLSMADEARKYFKEKYDMIDPNSARLKEGK